MPHDCNLRETRHGIRRFKATCMNYWPVCEVMVVRLKGMTHRAHALKLKLVCHIPRIIFHVVKYVNINCIAKFQQITQSQLSWRSNLSHDELNILVSSDK
jgi:hypothetical protein